MFLIVTTFRDDGIQYSYHNIPANCTTQINGSDYYYAGSISADDVGIQVSSGDLLRVM